MQKECMSCPDSWFVFVSFVSIRPVCFNLRGVAAVKDLPECVNVKTELGLAKRTDLIFRFGGIAVLGNVKLQLHS